MIRLSRSTLIVATLLASVVASSRSSSSVAEAQDGNAYFNALLARADFWKAWSLRPKPEVTDPSSPFYANQLKGGKDGGIAASNSCPQDVTYAPTADPDPHRQDAAKVVIPAFVEAGGCAGQKLTQGIDSTTTIIPMTEVTSVYVPHDRAIQVDSEIMAVVGQDKTAKTLTVQRGAYGSKPAGHAGGALVKVSNNSLFNYLRPALGTSDGNTYLFVWDAYWTDSYLKSGLAAHKTFQFTSSSDGQQLIEPRTRYDGGTLGAGRPGNFNPETDVAAVDIRMYNSLWTSATSAIWSLTNGNTLGAGTTGNLPLAPVSGTFIVKPNTWTRWFVRVEQRANDWDYMDMWVADENVNPVQIYTKVPISVRGTPGRISNFWFEFNTSDSQHVRGSTRDLVTYIRNFAVLVNPGNVPSLLLRPLAGVPPAYLVPKAPTNLKILS